MMYYVYCDESRQDLLASQNAITDKNRYCCLGGLMIAEAAKSIVKQQIKELKEKHNVLGEVKWSTVSPSRLQFYIDLVDLFFNTPELQFRTVVIDATKIRNIIYNQDDQELGYYKFYYQLLFHWFSWENKYRVFTDQKTNREKKRLQELKRIVNIKFCSDPIESIQAIDSRESLILQMQNVLMGAVGYKYNFAGNGYSKAKEEIVKRIEAHLGKPISKTPPQEYKFNIFQIELREER